MKIFIDPRGTYNYATYYIYGLEQVFGRKCLCYDMGPFKDLCYASRRELNSGIPIVIRADRDYRIFLDLEDYATIFEDRYEWCNVYGKVNPTKEQCDTLDKLIPIGPEFGIQLQGRVRTLLLALHNYLRGRKDSVRDVKEYLKIYAYTFVRRRRMEQFLTPVQERQNYIFHASTLWYNEFAETHTNLYRGEFLKACAKAGVEIDGGLYYLGEEPYVLKEMPNYARYKSEYKDFIYTERLPIDDYIRKTKESTFVFNTPSVCGCHGWKLGEYLCMGKAIISSPLTRELPGSGLVHGENVHFVSSPDEIYAAVCKLRDDDGYRKKLEEGAKKYYEEYVSPQAVILRICHNLGLQI